MSCALIYKAVPGHSRVKSPPVKQETWVQSLNLEDSLKEEMETYSNILAEEIPWTKDPGQYSPWGCENQTRLRNYTVTATDLNV